MINSDIFNNWTRLKASTLVAAAILVVAQRRIPAKMCRCGVATAAKAPRDGPAERFAGSEREPRDYLLNACLHTFTDGTGSRIARCDPPAGATRAEY